MRYFELFEGRDALLYHTMTLTKTSDVFGKDMMEDRWEHNIPGYGTVRGNSFTRNKNLNWNGCVKLTIDQRKLSSKNKIIPLDGEFAMKYSIGSVNKDGSAKSYPSMNTDLDEDFTMIGDRHINKKRQTLSEEFVVGPIKNLHLYIMKIELNNRLGRFCNDRPSVRFQIYKEIRKYSKQWNITLTVDPEIIKDLRSINRDEWHRKLDPEY